MDVYITDMATDDGVAAFMHSAQMQYERFGHAVRAVCPPWVHSDNS